MESSVANKKKNNWKLVVFGVLLIIPVVAVIHMGVVMIWGYYAFTTACWNSFIDYEYDVLEILDEIFTSVILAPANELVTLDIEKQKLEAAELGVKYKEICAVYYSEEPGQMNSLFLAANIIMHDSLIKAEILKQKELHPVSSFSLLNGNWQWKSIPVIIDDSNFQMTIMKKNGHYRVIVIEPESLKTQLQQIFDSALSKSFINERYLGPKEDYKYETKAFVSLYDKDAADPFFNYGDKSGKGWVNRRYDEDGRRNFFFGWKIKIEIFAKYSWMQSCAEQFQKFPLRFALETFITLIFIIILAFSASKLRKPV